MVQMQKLEEKSFASARDQTLVTQHTYYLLRKDFAQWS
jgi:hypothetical protein